MVVSYIRAKAPTLVKGLEGAALAAGALSTALLLASAPASAQDGKPVQLAPKPEKKPAAPQKPAAKPQAAPNGKDAKGPAVPEDTYPWVKICQKDAEGKSICLIAKELRGANGELIASVAVRDTEGEPKKTLLIAVPPGILVQPGMRVMIDKNKPVEVKYRICFPNACYGDFDLTDQNFGDLKKGNLLVVTALTLQQKPTGYPFRLDTFKAALESVGVDPSAGQQSQDQLQQELQKRAEEAAKKLQNGGAPKPQGGEAPKP